MQKLSNGGMCCARDCRRKYFYRYERAISRIAAKSDALGFGTLWHLILAVWFTTRDETRVWMAAGAESISYDHKQRVMAMFRGYIERWPSMPIMSLHEQPIEAVVRGRARSRSFTQYAILDMLALRADGTVWLYEHKTASSISGQYIEKLATDSQITGYVSALRDNGIEVEGVVYDVALKPRIKQTKKETEAEFYNRLADWHMEADRYHREEVFISDRQIADWKADQWATTQDILSSRRSGVWPRNTSRCFDYFSACEYLALCQNGESEALLNAEYEPRKSPSNNKPEKPAF